MGTTGEGLVRVIGSRPALSDKIFKYRDQLAVPAWVDLLCYAPMSGKKRALRVAGSRFVCWRTGIRGKSAVLLARA
jgi:hypothetical protein